MPPKVKVSKEMILEEAFQIARTEGAEKITARHIAERLSCSTQPVLYHFATVEEIKAAVYRQADEYHTACLMNEEFDYDDPMLTMGMNYIRFAKEEPHLFRFLFQSNEFSGATLMDLVELEDLAPMLQILSQEAEVTPEEAKEIFTTLAVYVHGYASFYANNEIIYDEKFLIRSLTNVFYGAIYAAKEDNHEETL